MLRFKSRRRASPALKPQGELTASERRVVRLMVDAMDAVVAQVERDLTRIADAVAHSPADKVADLVSVDPWYGAQEMLEGELLGELLDAGSRVELPTVEKAVLRFAFDRSRPESAAWARNESATLVREIADGQRQTIRDVVTFGQESGLSPQDTARQIRQTVGLTQAQGGWVNNFRDRQVAANINAGMGVDEAVRAAQGPTARYQSQIHRYRSTTIARTEIMSANSQGRQQAWGQGLQGGFISPNSRKEWIAESDACDICMPVNRMRVPITGQFPIGEPPAHPNCRCDVLLIPESVSPDLRFMSDAELDAQIAGLLGEALLPAAGLQPRSAADLLGDALEVRGKITPEMQQSLDDLAKLPAEVAERLRENGGRVSVFDGPITNHPDKAYLRGVQPRGWPAGNTWDDVGGAANGSRSYVGYTRQTGSVSTALHETGHVIDNLARSGVMGMSRDPRFRAAYLRAKSRLVDPYYWQAGDAGPQEAFAEAVAYVYSGRSTLWNRGYPEIRELLAVVRELVEAG